jgi:uncharacterized UPF0160 family protein
MICSNRVSYLNPSWLDDTSSELENSKFKVAMTLTGSEFIESVEYILIQWLPARKIVEECVAKRFDVHSSGEIIILDRWCPFQGHLFDMEDEIDELKDKIKYAIIKDSQRGYRVRCIPESNSSFTSRKPLPVPWRALRDGELSSVSGIGGCIFVHGAGFIGGNDTLEGAVEMAKKSLEFV